MSAALQRQRRAAQRLADRFQVPVEWRRDFGGGYYALLPTPARVVSAWRFVGTTGREAAKRIRDRLA